MQDLADRQFWRDIWYRSYKEFFSKTDKKFIRIASSIDGTRLVEFTREDFLTFEDPSVIIESKRKFEAERAKIATSLDSRLAVMEANPNSHKISLNYMSGMQVDIYIPTYGRADKLPGVLANIESSTTYPHRVIFILELDDIHSIRRVKELGLVPVINRRSHTYAGSFNVS